MYWLSFRQTGQRGCAARCMCTYSQPRCSAAAIDFVAVFGSMSTLEVALLGTYCHLNLQWEQESMPGHQTVNSYIFNTCILFLLFLSVFGDIQWRINDHIGLLSFLLRPISGVTFKVRVSLACAISLLSNKNHLTPKTWEVHQ